MSSTSRPPTAHIAVVGTGMAGLVTGYLLHHDSRGRYRVTVFEKQGRISLDAASVLLQDKAGHQELVDIPMRSISPGYYRNLTAMYDFLQIRYRIHRFLFAFSHETRNLNGSLAPYYIHPSNRHQLIPPRPPRMNLIHFSFRFTFLAVCYFWISICFLLVAPSPDETLESYLQRVWVPQRFVTQYLLPLISSMATCSHDELLRSPARDFIAYKLQLSRADHYSVEGGMWDVKRRLVQGLDIRLAADVEAVNPVPSGVRLSWRAKGNDGHESRHAHVFDDVVLAVSPNVVARIFSPLREVMARIPTTEVKTFVLQSADGPPNKLSILDRDDQMPRYQVRLPKPRVEIISLRTCSQSDQSMSSTTTYQQLGCGAHVVTNTNEQFAPSSVLSRAQFTRVLRSVESRKLVNELLGDDNRGSNPLGTASGWRNGNDGVWIAGSWCWGGMVLLEGCVVSAMRIAEAFDVAVPWAQAFISPQWLRQK